MGRCERRWKLTSHFFVRHRDGGREINQIAEDLAGLRVGVAAQALGQQAVEATGQDQQRHVEVNLEADGRGERIQMKEADRVGERVLNEHALGIAGEERLGRSVALVGQQNGGFRHGGGDSATALPFQPLPSGTALRSGAMVSTPKATVVQAMIRARVKLCIITGS